MYAPLNGLFRKTILLTTHVMDLLILILSGGFVLALICFTKSGQPVIADIFHKRDKVLQNSPYISYAEAI